jgi:hypothetical protein
MANPIKYNTSAETLALKKGNFYIGTGDVGKGPTSSTGYYNGVTPPSGGFTIYLNKASDGPAIYTASNEAQLTALTNTISVSTNLIKNNNGGNFADGTRAPFNYPYPAQTFPTIFDISNDKPYVGSSTKYALKFPGGVGGAIYSDPSPFTMTAGVVYTFSFWHKQNNSTQSSFNFNNQGGSGDINGNFIANITTGPSQTWQRFSWTFTNVINKVYFIISPMTTGSEVLMTEFTLTEGSMPGGPGLTTSGQCLNWFASVPTDKMIFNRDYESIVTNGLVLNLDAGFSPSFATIPSNANSSTVTPWYDLSLSGNNGTLTNGPTYSTNGGGTIVFDGTNDYVSLPNNLVGGFTGLTYGVWVYVNSLNNSSAYPGYIGAVVNNNASNNINLGIWISSTKQHIEISTTAQQNQAYEGTIDVPIQQWYYASMTWDGTYLTEYVNGVKGRQVTTNGSILSDTTFFGLGQHGGGIYFFDGKMSNVQVYNRALSATEVLQNYNATKGRFGL